MKPQNQGKKIIQSCKKIRSKPKTACKTVKADKFSHPSCQNPNRSDIEVTSGAKRGFAAMLCVAWRRKLTLRRKRNCGTQKGKTENHTGYQIRKPNSIFDKKRLNAKTGNSQTAIKTKTAKSAMLCVAWRRKLPLRRKRNCGTQKGKTENHIGYQIRKRNSIFDKNRTPNAKNRKIRKPQ